jgi:DNA-binding protein HU-beta
MNKADLVYGMSLGAKMPVADAKRAIESAIDLINKALKRGDRITISGFGSFQVKRRAERVGRNARTGQSIRIPPKNAVVFTASEVLEKIVNPIK